MEQLLKEGFSHDQVFTAGQSLRRLVMGLFPFDDNCHGECQVLRMMMEVGRTEEEEQEELRRQIHNFENDPSVIIGATIILSTITMWS